MLTREDELSLAESVLERVGQERIRFINLQFVDILGVVKSVTIPSHELEECIRNGKWFDGSSIEGFARIAESDMYLKPDLRTFATIPWEKAQNATARIICWIYTPNGDPFLGDPRHVLQRVVEEAEAMGYSFHAGPEFEFFLLKQDDDGLLRPSVQDRAGYFDLTTDVSAHVRKAMVNALEALGVAVESSHHETASGQHELDLKYDTALKAADNAVTVKYSIKAIAQRFGLHATFMPKPIDDVAGSGMHVHQSFFDPRTHANLFYDGEDTYGLSDIAKHFIAGQLSHARGMCAVVSPLVNSYKRLMTGYEAPVYISWARINRSALIRIPKFVPGNPQATRVELRCPDPSCNPYLAFAVMLKCGLDGIYRGLPLPPPVEENLYQFDSKRLKQYEVRVLPSSLGEAIDEFNRDTVVQEALGEHAFQRFLEAKQMEWDAYNKHVTPWEITRYLSMY